MWSRRPQGGGSGRPFRETRPRGPPPRLITPCPLVRPLLHPAVGPRARRAPRRAVDVAGGRGARQLAGRKRRPAPPGKAEVSGEVTAGGEHRSHRAPGAPIACGPAAPAPGGAAGGAPARGAPTAEGTRGPCVAPAEPRGRAVGVRAAQAGAPCHPGAVCGSLSLPLVPARRPGPSGVSSGRGAWVRRAGRLCRGSVGMALRSQRLVPLAPRPRFQRNEATPGSWISPEGPRAS